MKSHKKITRFDFLKNSGLIAAGFTFLPHTMRAMLKEPQENMQVNANDLTAYQIIVPAQPTL